jgi:DNA-binding NarL/FixJ family response regulator
MDGVIRVVLADDHAMMREGVRHVLSATPGFQVVGEAASGREAVEVAARMQPDVVVLDISMPEGSGLEVLEELRRRAPAARVLVLSVHDDTEYVLQSVRAGAAGYLRKDTTPDSLRHAVREIAAGNGWFSPEVARHLTAAIRDDADGSAQVAPAAPAEAAVLTARERDVLVRVARGLTNKQAAAELGISARTVETHRDNLMRKLGIRTVAGLTKFALDAGLIES